MSAAAGKPWLEEGLGLDERLDAGMPRLVRIVWPLWPDGVKWFDTGAGREIAAMIRRTTEVAEHATAEPPRAKGGADQARANFLVKESAVEAAFDLLCETSDKEKFPAAVTGERVDKRSGVRFPPNRFLRLAALIYEIATGRPASPSSIKKAAIAVKNSNAEAWVDWQREWSHCQSEQE